MPTPPAPTNGSGPKWFGVPIAQFISIVQGVGVPTALIGFLCYIAWIYVPPLVAGHVDLLGTTGDTLKQVTSTLENMDANLKNNQVVTDEIIQVQRETKKFMQQVSKDHETQSECLQKIRAALEQARKVGQ